MSSEPQVQPSEADAPQPTPSHSTGEGPVDSQAWLHPRPPSEGRRTRRGMPHWVWLVLAASILVGLSAVIMLTVEGQPDYISVKEAVSDPDRYTGLRLQVFGNVEDWNPVGGENRFVLNDTESPEDKPYLLLVDASKVAMPSGFAEQKGATVTGYLERDDQGQLKLVATEVRVGCPSKYESEKDPEA